jgi:hypothetical protein
VRLGAESALVLLAWALYLFDSVRLLASNEAIFYSKGKGWGTAFGALHWKIRGKEPYLPNPLTPHRQVFCLRWDVVRLGKSTQLALRPELRIYAPFVLISALCLLVLMPLGFATRAGSPLVIAALVVMYLSNALALLVLARRRATMGLSRSQYMALAVECLVCPPFAINLIRRLCALQPFSDDFVAASIRFLPVADLVEVNAQCLLRLNELIDCEEETGDHMAHLLAARARFVVHTP